MAAAQAAMRRGADEAVALEAAPRALSRDATRRARRRHAGDVDDGVSRLYRPDRRGRAAPGGRGRPARTSLRPTMAGADRDPARKAHVRDRPRARRLARARGGAAPLTGRDRRFVAARRPIVVTESLTENGISRDD